MKEYKKQMNKNIKKVALISLIALLFVFIDSNVSADSPYVVSWNLDGFYSDTYNIQDLTFVWGGDTGSNTDLDITGCTSDDCVFNTTYPVSGSYVVNVHAENNAGQVVSNVASCAANVETECPCAEGYICTDNRCVYDMDVSCGAYTSADAENPTLFFNPGSTVWWKAEVDGGMNPLNYEWVIRTENGFEEGTSNPEGPLYVSNIGSNSGDYDNGGLYSTYLTVIDDNGGVSNAICSMITKQCNTNSDCLALGFSEDYICNSEFTCALPPPIFLMPLGLDPSIVKEGAQCGMSWIVDEADSCIIYRNGEVYEANAPAAGDIDVDPGTYTISCENTAGAVANAGPVRCLVNPEIREN